VELRAFLRVLWRRWWLVAAPVLAVLAHLVLTYRPPPTFYQVVMRFAAGTAPPGLSVDYDRYYAWLTSEYIANGLADVARTRAFANAVAARLAAKGVSADPAAIQGAIVTDNAQSIAVVYLTWPDPSGAVEVARAVATELTENGAAYFPQIPWPQEAGPAARLLDEPVPMPLPPSLRAQLVGPAVRLALALGVGVGLALLWHYLDPTVREEAELEALGLRVLARIPRNRRNR
jgi:capsular polysaccharide biosynthesis protein